MENQSRHQEYRIRDKNRTVPDIIPLNTKDNDSRPPTGAPISDDESIVDSFLGHPPTESEGYVVSVDAKDGPTHSPSPASDISSPPQNSPPNNSQGGDIS